MTSLLLLGASGSIGEQALQIIENDPKRFQLLGISLGKRIDGIDAILARFPSIKEVCVRYAYDAEMLRAKHPERIFYDGDDGLVSLIEAVKPKMVINALVGFVGLVPTITALNLNIDVALANKETLVVGGELIKAVLKTSKAKIYPIDSEHVALAKCLEGKGAVDSLVITASGGPFRDYPRDQLGNVTKEQALKHPNWSMGAKITIDSATMMNKGFEVIEAHYLFNLPYSKIKVLLHDESKIHSMVRFKDGSYLADIGPSDMRISIGYALYKAKRHVVPHDSLSLDQFTSFHFRPYDKDRYPLVDLAYRIGQKKGSLPAVMNAANEVAVEAFLLNQISFLDIEKFVLLAVTDHTFIAKPTLADLISVDHATREYIRMMIEVTKQ